MNPDALQDRKILLRRGSVPCDGFEPNIEWLPLRASDCDHEAYADEMNARFAWLKHFAQYGGDA